MRTHNQWRSHSEASVGEDDDRHEQQRRDAVPRGTCKAMCPARELQNRESQNRLHRFEMVAGTEKDRRPKGDALRAVKEYSRPAAGKDSTHPADLRPPAVLLSTVCYLIDDIAASPCHHPWTEASIRFVCLVFRQSVKRFVSYKKPQRTIMTKYLSPLCNCSSLILCEVCKNKAETYTTFC